MAKANAKKSPPAPDLSLLDLGSLALLVGQSCAEAVRTDLGKHGYDDMRVSQAHVFQHVAEGSRGVTEIARRLGVTQQATSAFVRNLQKLGYVTVKSAQGDARKRMVHLTKRGDAVVSAAKKSRRALEAKLARKHGPKTVAACKKLLADVLEELGGVDAVASRNARFAL